ncbi:prepilin-type N-terminal cleavage/methylation domain-containing protein [Clostridium sp. Sa3CUN1]|uniref:Prepilin-type N-terminal cleavage/methylation domain-containing protein n=1 Tax=Clostridium gallinarum TaxID=2762246 RepID=A0ABR8Q6E1_9CLOT|nr:prepilin-type N-terminal cleavage/methylation domain-containing protein [Clostridium gallinarum]MBD7915997.1 prepilin-type N-terminal cleavage/methylation domain-containing protein [Clostridium gallinarum]
MKRKKGFTLLELMVALLVFLILSLMISTVLIQSQKILIRTDKSSQIQNEVRNSLLKIQTASKKYNEIIINDKFGYLNGNKWELANGTSYAREILRFSNDNEDVAKVYVEIYENNNHELIEFDINKLTNEIVPNSRNTLISNIEGNEVDKIKVYTENILNSSGQKINELVTINCLSIVNGDIQSESQYIISFTIESEDEINIDLGIGNGNINNGSSNTDDGSSNNNNGLENKPSSDESNIDEWDINKIYYKGDIVRYNNVIYKLAWEGNKGNNPEYGNAWTIITEEPTVWKRTKDYEGAQKVTHNGKIYISQWYANAGLEPGVQYVWKLIE